jgi:hypothetical protein
VRVSYERVSLGAIALAAFLAACHGAAGYTPSPPLASQSVRSVSPDAKIPPCTAPGAKVPGKYYVLFAGGNVKSGTFKSVSTVSSWNQDSVVASPSPKPSPTPTHAPYYQYYGTFALKTSKEKGCAYLLTTLSGKPLFPPETENAFADGVPKYEKSVSVKILQMGPLAEKIHGLGASGGSGTVTLSGAHKDTGSVTFVGRIILK